MVYWPAIFITTHLPVPQWVYEAQVSDKTAHFIAYLALAFMWWVTVSPFEKVDFRRPLVWWTLLVMVWYGAFDEWLQSYVGRNANVSDFLANLGGTVTSLIVLSIFAFWPALLVVTAILIFAATNLSHLGSALEFRGAYPTVHLIGYAFFALVWVEYLKNYRREVLAGTLRWFLTACVVPLLLLGSVKGFAVVFGKDFGAAEMIAAAAGIATVTLTFYFSDVVRGRVGSGSV